MQVLALQGSPRKKGNTAALLDGLLAELKAKGAKVRTEHVGSMKISGCIECFACQKVEGKPGCAVEDDMQKIYRAMLKADLIVFASPVFCWGPTAQLKAVLDRCYALFKFSKDGGDYKCFLKGKHAALVVTAGGGKEDGADLIDESLQQLARYGSMKYAGMLFAHGISDPKAAAADQRLMQRAKKFAQKLRK